jgi:hypothetical protein
MVIMAPTGPKISEKNIALISGWILVIVLNLVVNEV